MMHGQCYARPTITFPAKEHHHPLAGTKFYRLVNRGTCARTTCPKLLPGSALGESQTSNLTITSLAHYHYTTNPERQPVSNIDKTQIHSNHSLFSLDR